MSLFKRNQWPIKDAYPLTSTERGMYLEQRLNPDSILYNINIGIYISGVEAGQIRKAMGQILLAHEAFHAAYTLMEGVPHRVLLKEAPEIKTEGCVSRASFDTLAAEPGEPFDLDAGVPLRLTLYPLLEGGFGKDIHKLTQLWYN